MIDIIIAEKYDRNDIECHIDIHDNKSQVYGYSFECLKC